MGPPREGAGEYSACSAQPKSPRRVPGRAPRLANSPQAGAEAREACVGCGVARPAWSLGPLLNSAPRRRWATPGVPPPQIPGGSGAGKSSPCPACRARLPAGIRQVDPGGCTFLPAPDPLLLLTLSQSPGAPPVRVGSRSLSPPNYLPREVTVRILPGMRKGGLGSAQCHIPRGGVPT